MNLQLLRMSALALSALFLVACGGSSDNASPGSVVIVQEVERDPPPEPDPEPEPEPEPPVDGTTTASVIPEGLQSVIADSGATASAAFENKPIYTIDVAGLSDGQLDPTGLLLGNDFIFEISGGALRVTPPENGDCELDMAPGAVLAGGSSEDFLVIERGCKLMADGSSEDGGLDQPILFTARAEVDGDAEDNDRGLWGGLVINGYAPINDCPEGADGGTDDCTKEGEANSGLFGGSDPNDDSGVLKYVSVRFAGSNVDPENQLNGIAFQAVGDATEVDYVQVHNNLDDGVEFFGGTVNAKHVVLTGNADDSLDWTDGWTGRIQYLYIEQTDSADNAIEADNREGNEGATPRSNPTIANMSVLGNPEENALRLRRGTGLALRNSFVDGSATCIRVDGSSRDLLGTGLTVEGVSFACAETHRSDSDGAVANYLAGATNVSTNGDAVDPVGISDTFFDSTDFIGAFGTENWSAGWTYPGSVSNATQPDFGCPAGTNESTRDLAGMRVCQLSNTSTDDVLLTSNNLYELVGKVTIGGDNADSATLTAQAGTTIFGGTNEDFLVISRGSRFVANGTRTAPVTLTARADLAGQTSDNDRGLWGGLVINGNAPINDCPEGATGGTAECTKEGEANSGLFGGDDADDSSGVLNYLVVKFAGSNVDPENQLNGIAFQGVGSGTEVDYIQVHNNLDDGVEFFGGTVNAKHVVLTGNADDSLDWTDGWQGNIQYLVIDQADDSGDNGIEADNREGDEDAMPRSLPRIANMTITGKSDERAVRLRRGTGLELYNSVVQDSANCLRIQGASLDQLGTGITFDGVSFDCDTVVEGDDVAAIQAELDGSNVSTTGQVVEAADLSSDSFFEDTDFIGAVRNADEDWTHGWAVGMPHTATDFVCPDGSTQLPDARWVSGRRTCELSGTITDDITLTRSNYYILDGKVTIGGDNRDSAVLGIESGTTIIGDDPEDFLVIARGSRIEANGTRHSPITLTAVADVTGEVTDPVSERGLWGGLVINGNAPINDCPEGAQGGTAECTKEGEANSGLFGGDDANDSSGTLRYVVVKFAGSNVDPENQLNGIAFQGVGDGTVVDYIQVYNNLDDGVEFFGGTVNASHVVLVGNADDSLDWTDGWVGSIQYLHILQPESVSADNMIEADNREGDEQATPISEPYIANMTMMGHSGERAIRLRRGTGLHLYNSEVSGSANCLRVQGESANLLGTRIRFSGVKLDCATVNEGDDVAAVQTFLDGSTNVTVDGSTPTPVPLPAANFGDDAGGSIIGSDIANWGSGWTVGLDN